MLGVNIALVQDGKILLTKREDFEIWCMPGGHVDSHESLAAAAVREMVEETGLQVRLTALIGLYSRPNWQAGEYHIASFLAELVGGELTPDPHEVLDIGWFSPDDLPPMIVGHRQRVVDAFAGVGGLVRTELTEWPLGDEVSRPKLYALRDESGESRSGFYTSRFVEGASQLDLVGLPIPQKDEA